jgi:NAD(P)-dependent dehydrogenase (short-subunit alcohol dehydrogenase family)
MPPMPTILVTGANRGLGLEMVRQYAAEGWNVFACCRNPDAAASLKELAATAINHVSIEALDIEDHSSIDSLAGRLQGVPIDVLLNNAGNFGAKPLADYGLQSSPFGKSDFRDWMKLFWINCIAPMKMAEAFIENVAASNQRKIVSVTSIAASMTKNVTGDYYSYRSSKAALNAVARSMAIDLKQRRIIVIPLHPGWVRTDMGSAKASLDVKTSVSGQRSVIESLTLDHSGRFFSYDGSELPW